MRNREKHHIQALDGLRGLAILLVLFYHYFSYGFLSPFFSFGWIGVELFFVLSGFLITGILIDTKHKKGFIPAFLLRRALRTLPLYYGVLVIFALIAPYFGPTSWFSRYQVFFWTHTSNFLVLYKGFFKPLGHFWSLAMEEQFYIVWPFIVLFCNKKQLLWVAVALIITSIGLRMVFTNPNLTFGLPLAHADGISVGAIIAVLMRLNKEAVFRYSNWIFAGALLLFSVLFIYGINDKEAPLTLTILSLFFGALLIVSLRGSLAKKIFSHRLLLFFGKYSYGMYVYNSLFFYFSNWAGADRLPVNVRLLVYAGDFLLMIAVSYGSYYFYEAKFLSLKDRVNRIFMGEK